MKVYRAIQQVRDYDFYCVTRQTFSCTPGIQVLA